MTRVVCAIILSNEGKILLAQRPAGKHLAMKWEFPGGKVEEGESANAALIREINEELGCSLMVMDELPRCVHAYERGSIELVPFVCKICKGEPRALEHAAIEWTTPELLKDFDLAPADIPVLEHLLCYLSENMPRLFQK